MAAKTTRAEGWSTAMPKRLSKLGETARKRIRKQWNETVEMLPPVPRKALKRLTANVDRARHDLRKSGDRVVADVRKRAERLADEAQKRLEGTIGAVDESARRGFAERYGSAAAASARTGAPDPLRAPAYQPARMSAAGGESASAGSPPAATAGRENAQAGRLPAA